jgi:chorismate synthase
MNSFGKIFRTMIFGESHGPYIGVTIDGCPPGISITEDIFRHDLDRRKAGQPGATERVEHDKPEIISGVFNGFSTGAPLTILFKNSQTRSNDYKKIKDSPRPGHADYALWKKYKGFNDYRGGGCSSGRLTVGVVAAGVIAKKIIDPVIIEAEIIEAGGISDIQKAVEQAKNNMDSIGGKITCQIKGIPAGLGEPFFNSVESVLSHAVFSIPGIKAIEFGDGIQSSLMQGNQFNDEIISPDGKTLTNHSGGINGGITNGNEIIFTVHIRPTASIGKPQKTINIKTGKPATIEIEGRHDTCIALRMPVIIEAMAAIAVADLKFINRRIS